MKSIVLREIQSFFGSPVGYLVIALFLLVNGVFLWIFEGDYNLLTSGFADLTPFFTLAPWILLFLIPAVTMRSFSDEKKQGTLELLLTKPLSIWEIATGKFLGSLLLIVIAVLPTFLYVYILSSLGLPEGNIDMGSTLGSYFGLFFLICGYTSIGIYTSTLAENQIVAFIIAVFLCFTVYFGFDGIAGVFPTWSPFITVFGMQDHFKSMSRGVLDTRDLLYFASITILFLSFTVYNLKSIKA